MRLLSDTERNIIRNRTQHNKLGYRDEKARIVVLRECQLLDTDTHDPNFDRFTSLAQRIFNAESVSICFIDIERVWVKSSLGIDILDSARDETISSYIVEPDCPDVFVVMDTLTDERFTNLQHIFGPPGISFYAGTAITCDHMKVIGRLI